MNGQGHDFEHACPPVSESHINMTVAFIASNFKDIINMYVTYWIQYGISGIAILIAGLTALRSNTPGEKCNCDSATLTGLCTGFLIIGLSIIKIYIVVLGWDFAFNWKLEHFKIKLPLDDFSVVPCVQL